MSNAAAGRTKPPKALHVLGVAHWILALAGFVGLVTSGDLDPLDAAGVVLSGLGGWGLLTARRWGYWFAAANALWALFAAIYLLGFAQGRWATQIGALALVFTVLMAFPLLIPSSWKWVTGRR